MPDRVRMANFAKTLPLIVLFDTVSVRDRLSHCLAISRCG